MKTKLSNGQVLKDETKKFKSRSGALRWLERHGFVGHAEEEEDLGITFETTYELIVSDTVVWEADLSYSFHYDTFNVEIYYSGA